MMLIFVISVAGVLGSGADSVAGAHVISVSGLLLLPVLSARCGKTETSAVSAVVHGNTGHICSVSSLMLVKYCYVQT